jgi:hypothetical protein
VSGGQAIYIIAFSRTRWATIGAFCILAGGKQNAQRRIMAQLTLEGTTDYKPSYRAQIVQSLADFRREWQKMAEGQNLIDVQASVGLMLADVADRLDLNPQERHIFLGGKLINQVNCLMEERIEA